MKIAGQDIAVRGKYYVVKLHSPFWSAYQKYNWESGVEGFGLSQKLINRATIDKKKIMVVYKGNYEITPSMARKMVNFYHSTFVARNGELLGIVPKTAFKKVAEPEENVTIDPDVRFKLKELWNNIQK